MTTPSAHQADGGEREAVRRYDVYADFNDRLVHEAADGSWVHSDDYDAAVAARGAAVEAKEKAERALADLRLAVAIILDEYSDTDPVTRIRVDFNGRNRSPWGSAHNKWMDLYAAHTATSRAALDAGEGKP
jgi:hypothetical protein